MERDITNEEFKMITDLVREKKSEVEKLPTKEDKLEIYAHGMQGGYGDCENEKPAFYEIKEKFKWEAWNDLKGMDKQNARRRFYELTKEFHGVTL